MKKPTETPKKVAPSKPKRKSISAISTPVPNIEKKKRYFEESDNKEETVNEPIETRLNDSFEKKRQRLLQKVELAKKGWTGLGAMQNSENLEISQNPENAKENPSVQNPENPVNPEGPEDLDTTPYEEIDDDSFEESRREPIGILPSFISLNTNTNEEEEEFEERLI